MCVPSGITRRRPPSCPSCEVFRAAPCGVLMHLVADSSCSWVGGRRRETAHAHLITDEPAISPSRQVARNTHCPFDKDTLARRAFRSHLLAEGGPGRNEEVPGREPVFKHRSQRVADTAEITIAYVHLLHGGRGRLGIPPEAQAHAVRDLAPRHRGWRPRLAAGAVGDGLLFRTHVSSWDSANVGNKANETPGCVSRPGVTEGSRTRQARPVA